MAPQPSSIFYPLSSVLAVVEGGQLLGQYRRRRLDQDRAVGELDRRDALVAIVEALDIAAGHIVALDIYVVIVRSVLIEHPQRAAAIAAPRCAIDGDRLKCHGVVNLLSESAARAGPLTF